MLNTQHFSDDVFTKYSKVQKLHDYVLGTLKYWSTKISIIQSVKMTKSNTMVLLLVGLTLLGTVQVQSLWIPGPGLRMDCKV